MEGDTHRAQVSHRAQVLGNRIGTELFISLKQVTLRYGPQRGLRYLVEICRMFQISDDEFLWISLKCIALWTSEVSALSLCSMEDTVQTLL